MFRRDTFYLILILASVIWFSELHSSPFTKNKFEISIKGDRGDLQYLKLKADYRTLRKGRYCKGSFISYSNFKWKCNSEAEPRCTKNYKCKRVNREFNIRSESIRIRSAMKKTGMIKPKRHKIWISQKPRREKKSKKVARLLSPNTFSDVQYLGTGPIRGMVSAENPEELLEQNRQKRVKIKQLRKKIATEDAMSELRAEAKEKSAKRIAKRKFKKTKKIAEAKKSNDLDELEKIDDDEFQEELDVSEDSTESDIDLGDELEENKSFAVNDSDNSNEGSLFEFFAFSAGYISITDATQSLSTVELAWTPRVKFGSSSTFGIRGHFGIHQYSLPETAALTSETLLITNIKLLLYKYFGNFILEIGVGTQSWGGSIAESYQTLSGTIGYKFETPILKAVDRVYIHSMQIAQTEAASSLEFGLGISF
jgi:hypothetical protein